MEHNNNNGNIGRNLGNINLNLSYIYERGTTSFFNLKNHYLGTGNDRGEGFQNVLIELKSIDLTPFQYINWEDEENGTNLLHRFDDGSRFFLDNSGHNVAKFSNDDFENILSWELASEGGLSNSFFEAEQIRNSFIEYATGINPVAFPATNRMYRLLYNILMRNLDLGSLPRPMRDDHYSDYITVNEWSMRFLNRNGWYDGISYFTRSSTFSCGVRLLSDCFVNYPLSDLGYLLMAVENHESVAMLIVMPLLPYLLRDKLFFYEILLPLHKELFFECFFQTTILRTISKIDRNIPNENPVPFIEERYVNYLRRDGYRMLNYVDDDVWKSRCILSNNNNVSTTSSNLEEEPENMQE